MFWDELCFQGDTSLVRVMVSEILRYKQKLHTQGNVCIIKHAVRVQK